VSEVLELCIFSQIHKDEVYKMCKRVKTAPGIVHKWRSAARRCLFQSAMV